jgi:hypothetical protein
MISASIFMSAMLISSCPKCCTIYTAHWIDIVEGRILVLQKITQTLEPEAFYSSLQTAFEF